MVRAGQALMYAAGGTFAVVGFLTLVSYFHALYTGVIDWFLAMLAVMALYWWLFPLLAIIGFVGWYMARGTSREAALTMIIGGAAFTFTIFYLLAVTNFWGPLVAAAALLYIPSIITLALGIHAYVAAPPVTGGRIGLAIYRITVPSRRALKPALNIDHSVAGEERRRRALR